MAKRALSHPNSCDSNKSLSGGVQIRKLNKVSKGLKVYTTHLPYKRTYKVCGLMDTPANKHMFDYEGRQASVADYFTEKYKPLQVRAHPTCTHQAGGFSHVVRAGWVHQAPGGGMLKVCGVCVG